MKATAEKVEKNTILLEVEVDADHFSKAVEQAYRKLVKNINVPGFRKGKAPRLVFERFVGKKALYDEAMEEIIPEAYEKAVVETGIEPVGQPSVEMVQVEEGKPVVFKATVEVMPEVNLGQYLELEVVRPGVDIREEDVQVELERLRERHSKLVPVYEDAVKKGDMVIIDFTGLVDGEPFEGSKGEDYYLEVGSGIFIPGFEDQIIGMVIDETKEIKVVFPEDYPAENLRGKEAVFQVTLTDIKRKEAALLDDEFAKDVSEFETLEELKSEIRNKLKQNALEQRDYEVRRRVLEKAMENAEIEGIPQMMVERRIDEMLLNMERNMRLRGFSLKDYFKFTGSDLVTLREEMRPEAEHSVKATLVLDAIARKEGFQIEEEELNCEIKRLAEQSKQDLPEFRKQLEQRGDLELIREGLLREKTIKYITEGAKIIDDPGQDLEGKEEEVEQSLESQGSPIDEIVQPLEEGKRDND